MTRYVDTSALLKHYIEESGSADVHEILRSGLIVSSRFTEIELPCVLHRMARNGQLSRAGCDAALSLFLRDWLHVCVVDINEVVCRAALDVMARHPLKAGDALQLASALRVRAHGESLEFVVFDKQLLRAARGEGLTIWDPVPTGGVAALASDAPPPRS